LKFIHQQFRGQGKKARNQLNFKNSTTTIGFNDITQLERVQNNIGQTNKKIGTQQRITHKRNLKNETRTDLKNQNSTTGKLRFRKRDFKYLC